MQTASSKPSFRYGPPPSKRSNTGSNSPSPNHYNIPDFTQGLNKKVGKSLTARRPEISIKSEIPDPGAYKIKLSPSSPSFSLGSGNRDSFIPSNNNPAPSEYSVSTAIIQKSKSTQFGKGTRPPLSVPNDNPGPG